MRFVVACVSALVLSACATSMSPPPSSARAVVEAKFAAVNRHAVADVVALYAPDARITASDFCAPRQGRADVERIYTGIIAAIPDVSADVQEYVVDDNRVAVRFVVRGHIGATAIALPIMDFFTVEKGLIVRDDGIFDNRGRPCSP